MDERLQRSLAFYYGRLGHYETMLDIAIQGKQKFPLQESEFRLLSLLALKFLGRADEMSGQLELLSGECSLAARMLFNHTVPSEGSESMALVLLLTQQPEKAKEISIPLLRFSESLNLLCLCGWAEIDLNMQSSLNYFEKALKINLKDFEANLGKAKCFELNGDLDKSLELLNQLVVRFPKSSVPLIEKMNLLLAMKDWEQAIEQAKRIQNLNSHSIEATKLKVMKSLCIDGNFEEGNANIRKLRTDLDNNEPANALLYFETAKLISRICSRNPAILEETRILAQKAVDLNSTSCSYLSELAHITLLQGRIKEAIKLYKSAVKLDSSSLAALCGLTFCKLAESQSEAVKQQVELLQELQSTEATPILLYMCAIINEKDKHLLVQAIENHLAGIDKMTFGMKYLATMDPDFLLELIKELLRRLPRKQNRESTELNFILKAIKPMVSSCPGMIEARILQAEALYLSGDVSNSLSQLRCFSDSTEAQLLIARILLDRGDITGANKSLEVALSYNFAVRDHPLYLLIVAKNHRDQGNLQEAMKSLQNALKKEKLSISDSVTLTLELVEIYKLTGRSHDAAQALKEAMFQCQGSSEEGLLTLAQADLAISSGLINEALETLRCVLPSEPFYLESRHKMADIYLYHKKDRRMFAACYRDIVEQRPGPESQVLLGDAYMKVQEPEKAIEAYESALKKNPREAVLVRKVGQALVKTHLFGKAINFYTDAVKRDSGLRRDLAELLLRLKQYDKAESVLKQVTATPSSIDLEDLMSRCKLLLLLARVQEQAGSVSNALATLSEARDVQAKVVKRLQVEGSGTLSEERIVAASICLQMADHTAVLKNHQDAIRLYRESLTHKPDHHDTLLALAKLYLQVNDLTQCQATCSQLLRIDRDNEAASVMMADLSFRRTDYETATFHFQQLLTRQPRYWTALARLIEVMRRSGNLQDAVQYLEKAAVGQDEPGLAYCQGLHCWYSGDSSLALRHFNRARRDAEWGRQAIYNMIEICINPDSSSLGPGVLESMEPDLRDSREAALCTAERLLSELRPRPVSEERGTHRLLGCFLMLTRREKSSAEQALQELSVLAGDESARCNVGVTLAIAMAYLILKQTTRARNQLKRVAKQGWTFEEAEYLERCWLMLADLYIQAGKYDVASELLRRALQHNKSCTKAYEYLGFITEKEQLYREAATNYEQAWKFSNKTNPAIGYKLAFNYLKGKRFVEAIDICHQVLASHPNYPRIHKDILEKARNSLRT